MRDNFLGFLLGALEPDEQDAVRRHLEENPDEQTALARLQRCLEPLAADREPHLPPPGLAARTLAMVTQQGTSPVALEPLSGAAVWQWHELLLAACIFCAAALLFVPALNHNRFEARVASCQNNLRMIGQALVAYSEHQGNFFPFVPPQGNLAVAGIYAPLLRESGFLSESRHVVCPEQQRRRKYKSTDLPTLAALMGASPEKLKSIQARAGGTYGYTFGHMGQGRYQGTRNQGRGNFALMSDMPCDKNRDLHSANHNGGGQNVLFEDGHVRFVRTCRTSGGSDDFFHNDRGVVAAGLHADDSVIAASCRSPGVPLVFVGGEE